MRRLSSSGDEVGLKVGTTPVELEMKGRLERGFVLVFCRESELENVRICILRHSKALLAANWLPRKRLKPFPLIALV